MRGLGAAACGPCAAHGSHLGVYAPAHMLLTTLHDDCETAGARGRTAEASEPVACRGGAGGGGGGGGGAPSHETRPARTNWLPVSLVPESMPLVGSYRISTSSMPLAG